MNRRLATTPEARAAFDRKIADTKRAVESIRLSEQFNVSSDAAPVVLAVRQADLDDEEVARRRHLWVLDPVGCLGRALALVGCAHAAKRMGVRLADVVLVYDESRNLEALEDEDFECRELFVADPE